MKRLIFLFLISQSPAALRLEAQGMREWDGSGKELETQALSGRWGWSVKCWASPSLRQAWLGGKCLEDEAGVTKSQRP